MFIIFFRSWGGACLPLFHKIPLGDSLTVRSYADIPEPDLLDLFGRHKKRTSAFVALKVYTTKFCLFYFDTYFVVYMSTFCCLWELLLFFKGIIVVLRSAIILLTIFWWHVFRVTFTLRDLRPSFQVPSWTVRCHAVWLCQKRVLRQVRGRGLWEQACLWGDPCAICVLCVCVWERERGCVLVVFDFVHLYRFLCQYFYWSSPY